MSNKLEPPTAALAGKAASVVAICAFLFCPWIFSAEAASVVANISTRMNVETGNNVLIAGFIVSGTGQKSIALRALGPSLPVRGALSDPQLELHDATGKIIASNDSWKSSQQSAITTKGLALSDDRECALIVSIAPGNYTAIVRGANNTSGIGLVEVYDLDGPNAAARLANISTRGQVLTDQEVMIGGFIIQGDAAKRVITRVDGPSLTSGGAPIAGSLQDPTLELHDGNGTLLASNDNWRTTQSAEIIASTLAPNDDREPAIISTLSPGNYTAVVRGAGNTTGIALVEMFDLDQPPQADGSTLYLAQLRPPSGIISGGSGTATLRLSKDEASAVLAFSFTNLSSAVTDIHIESSTGQLLFDVSAGSAQPDGTYNWTFSARGTYSVADIIAALKAGQLKFVIQTSSHPSGEISGAFNLSSGAQTAPIPTPAPPLASGTPSPQDACRFLAQSTFGPTSALITHVQQKGFDGFLSEQFAATPSSHIAFLDASGVNPPTLAQTMQGFWTYAVMAPDQLRQRVAFALSELFVVSDDSSLRSHPDAMSTYMDVLVHDAFANYRTLLEDVTLNPAMGRYLDMLHNDKANPTKNTEPNENYAREVMQLFSIGLYRLNLDGSLTLSSQGLPIDTYEQDAVLGLAAVFTGWNYAQQGTPSWYGAPINFRQPMEAVPSHHEPASKQILNGVVIPANQSPQQDLKVALDTIFNHPNVGPFVCQQLIQRLVTSNPSPGYVYRVTAVFNNNGQGVRGDLKAVVRAILMDYDARGAAKTDQGYGHEREPVVRLTTLLRAFNATAPDGKFTLGNATDLGQTPLRAPSVFNFFSPDYVAPGSIAQAGLTSPEFEITTETTVSTIANYLYGAIYSGLGPSSDRVTLNLSAEISLASNPAALVDNLSVLLMAGGMSSSMRTTIVNAVTNIPANNPIERARTAIYLVINSPEFVVEK